MFKILNGLVQATVGVAVELPVAVAADLITLGGTLTDKDRPYTADATSKIVRNIASTTERD